MRRIGWLTLLLVLLAAPPAKGEQVIANFVPTYQYPHSLSWDGASLWVQENGPTIHRHDPLTGRELWTFTPDLSRFISSTAIACDGIHVWGCNWPELQIAELDPVDGHVLHLLGLHSPDGVGGAPTGLVWKDGALWMLTTGPNTI